MKKLSLIVIFVLLAGAVVRSEEGMWIPLLLKKYKIEDMRRAGFRLTAEDVYSVNQACLKDAIVIFGGGCTAELISGEGLLITNHHCGYGNIQKHSTVEHDYLTDGFWAMTRAEELPNPGLTVSFLVRIEDVSTEALAGVTATMTPAEREKSIQDNSRKIQTDAVAGTAYTGRVTPFFGGNQYFLFVYETYQDIRLVGAPPSSIGKFGGETDNWIWPRHTGDFSLFRIYSGPDNKPAGYSKDNIPFKPRKFFPISLRGVEKGDFTMVFGYPGRTTEYVPSFVIGNQVKYTIPASIDLRTKRLEIISAAMESSPAIRIQYAAKKSGIANSWKKNQGVLLGLKRVGAVGRKTEFESRFSAWVDADPARQAEYGLILSQYREITSKLAPYELAMTFAREAGDAAEIIGFAGRFANLVEQSDRVGAADLQALADKLRPSVEAFFKDYDAPTDQQLLAVMMKAYSEGIAPEFQPDLLRHVLVDFKGDFSQYARRVFEKSTFDSQDQVMKMLTHFDRKSAKRIATDPAFMMFRSMQKLQKDIINPGLAGQEMVPDLQRRYMKAQMEMQPDKLFYPDANSTLRVTFGKVDDFTPADGIRYRHYTTLDGIMQKDNPDVYDYRVPAKLKQLFQSRDFGQYAVDQTVPVCFIASNHTSGGNSGSPVINAEGQLIGINFDRNWEGTMSDLMYDPDLCRNISLDIRFALFIIDKYAGATHLIGEMQLVK